jgi:hypothetical protein
MPTKAYESRKNARECPFLTRNRLAVSAFALTI